MSASVLYFGWPKARQKSRWRPRAARCDGGGDAKCALTSGDDCGGGGGGSGGGGIDCDAANPERRGPIKFAMLMLVSKRASERRARASPLLSLHSNCCLQANSLSWLIGDHEGAQTLSLTKRSIENQKQRRSLVYALCVAAKFRSKFNSNGRAFRLSERLVRELRIECSRWRFLTAHQNVHF